MSNTELTDYIDHQAIVETVNKEAHSITVRIDDKEECGECPASKFCGSNGQPSNKVIINADNVDQYRKGDIITIRGTEQMHRKAVMYATVLPCIALVAVMVGIYLLTGNQLTAALCGIGVTILFYILIYICRNRIAHEFTFTIVGDIERPGEEK